MLNLHRFSFLFFFFFLCIQTAQVEAWLHPIGVWFWNWNEKVGTAVLHDVEYDTVANTVVYMMWFKKETQTSLVWCLIWLRETNVAIFYDVQYDSKGQTLPSCVKFSLIHRQTVSHCTMTLVMTQRGKLGHLVWRAEYETERQTLSSCVNVEYDREANVDGSVWRNDERDAQV